MQNAVGIGKMAFSTLHRDELVKLSLKNSVSETIRKPGEIFS